MGYKISALTAAVSSPTGSDLFEVSRYNGSTYDSRKMSWTQIIAGIALAVGTVTSVSVASANGFSGTVATATTTPAISIRTTVTGLMYGNGTAASAATNAQVTAYGLTGLSISGGAVTAADSMITAFGKLQNQINGVLGGATYQGTWNASTNSPALVSSVGTNGYYYIVSVAGATNLDGITDWKLGDWAIFAGTTWQKVDNTDAVISVNGLVGAVALTGTANRITVSGANVFDISAAYVGQTSITTLGTITTGTWNGTAVAAAFGGTGQTTYTIGDVLYASGTTTLTKLGIGSVGQVLTVAGGVISWATPSSGISGSGTANTITKWTGTSSIGNSGSTDDGTRFTVGGFLKIGSGLEHSTIGQVNITADQTDWNLGTTSLYQANPTANRTIQGVVAPTSGNGNEIIIENVSSSFNLIFINNSTTTGGGGGAPNGTNRINIAGGTTGSTFILPPNQSISLIYDSGFAGGARWRLNQSAQVLIPNVNTLVQAYRMTADVTRSATTVFTNLTDLTCTTIVGKKYRVVLDLFVSSSTTGGGKVDFTGTATTWAGFGELFETTPTLLAVSRLTALSDTVGSNATSGANMHFKIVATFIANSTTLIPRFAQNSAAGVSNALTNSFLTCTELP